jgi:hypothetical protein
MSGGKISKNDSYLYTIEMSAACAAAVASKLFRLAKAMQSPLSRREVIPAL